MATLFFYLKLRKKQQKILINGAEINQKKVFLFN